MSFQACGFQLLSRQALYNNSLARRICRIAYLAGPEYACIEHGGIRFRGVLKQTFIEL